MEGSTQGSFIDARARLEYAVLCLATFLIFFTNAHAALLAAVFQSHSMPLDQIGIILSSYGRCGGSNWYTDDAENRLGDHDRVFCQPPLDRSCVSRGAFLTNNPGCRIRLSLCTLDDVCAKPFNAP